MISYKSSPDIEYNGVENCARMQLFADTSSELTGVTHFDGIRLLQGSTAYVISTGEKWMLDGSGSWILQPSDRAFSNVYTKSEIDSMLLSYYTKTEADELFEWITVTITTDTLPLTFIADGTPLISWSMKGNGSQQGTPTPDNPVMPEFVGKLVGSDLTIPITCAGQTVPVYLGQVSTVRRVRKLVLTGQETWNVWNLQSETLQRFFVNLTADDASKYATTGLCSHFRVTNTNSAESTRFSLDGNNRYTQVVFIIERARLSTVDVTGFKAYLAAQYAAENPVTVWYVLANEQTGIVNEPLAKIGDYADELHSEDAAVTIPTVKGQNVLTVDTPIQPSEITITGKIRET